MRRFLLLLLNEFKLFRTALTVHLVAIFQPTLMYLLMLLIPNLFVIHVYFYVLVYIFSYLVHHPDQT